MTRFTEKCYSSIMNERRRDSSNISSKEIESPQARRPMLLLLGFWISVGIALAVVVRRIIAIARPASGGPPQMVAVDATFSSHAALTLAHILPAAVFVVLASIVLFRQAPGKWLESSFYLFGAITGLTAYLMNTFAIGGWVERSAVLVFNTWFLYSLGRAYFYKENALRRSWMTRAVAILLGIATTRPVMGIFFATSALTHLKPNQFFGFAFWIGFSINALAVEIWLRHKNH